MAHVMRILSENSTQKYYIRFKGYMSNHVSQGVIALDRLGADEDMLVKKAEMIGAVLRPAGEFKEQWVEKNTPPASDFPDIQDQSYYAVLDDYHRMLTREYRGNISKFLAVEFPKIAPGLEGDLFHGVIQLGYGIAAGHSETILEGMAWLKFSAVVPKVPLEELEAPYQPASVSPIELLERVRNDKQLRTAMVNGKKFSSLVHSPDSAQTLLQYTNQLALDGYPSQNPDQPINADQIGLALVRLAVTIYTTSKVPNDFILLHGVTSAWSIRNILHYLEDQKDINMVVRIFVIDLLATYLAQDAPQLDPGLAQNVEADAMSWDQLKKVTLGKLDRDVHVFKLAQVCSEMSGEDRINEHLYKAAVLSCLKHPFYFG